MLPLSRLDRTEKLLAGLDIATTTGLEIGALATPMLRPTDARIRFVDHADQAALRAKYANDPAVNLDKIVPVDAVWGENTLADCFPGELFDYVIASHVIEHVPDMIGWLAEIAAVLRPNGRLILAIPDRRYTYDLERAETRLSELVDNHLRGARRPTPGQVFDYHAGSVAHDHMDAWFPKPGAPPPAPFADRASALSQAIAARDGAYLDGHCTVFTARSLLELLDGLLELRLLPFRLARFHVAPVGSGEMSLVLLREPPDADPDAARTAIRVMLDLGADSEGLELETVIRQDAAACTGDAARIAALEGSLADMRASTSWRITAVLRAAARGVGRAPRART